MGYDDNIYYHPEKYGLVPLGEIEWDDEPYQFSITALWWSPANESFFTDEDSGCSCPSPFEDSTMESLERVISLTDFKSRLSQRMTAVVNYRPNREPILREEIGRLLAAAREKGMRL